MGPLHRRASPLSLVNLVVHLLETCILCLQFAPLVRREPCGQARGNGSPTDQGRGTHALQGRWLRTGVLCGWGRGGDKAPDIGLQLRGVAVALQTEAEPANQLSVLEGLAGALRRRGWHDPDPRAGGGLRPRHAVDGRPDGVRQTPALQGVPALHHEAPHVVHQAERQAHTGHLLLHYALHVPEVVVAQPIVLVAGRGARRRWLFDVGAALHAHQQAVPQQRLRVRALGQLTPPEGRRLVGGKAKARSEAPLALIPVAPQHPFQQAVHAKGGCVAVLLALEACRRSGLCSSAVRTAAGRGLAEEVVVRFHERFSTFEYGLQRGDFLRPLEEELLAFAIAGEDPKGLRDDPDPQLPCVWAGAQARAKNGGSPLHALHQSLHLWYEVRGRALPGKGRRRTAQLPATVAAASASSQHSRQQSCQYQDVLELPLNLS
eukprot:scaffold885_cov381-Prasinococcus_capsulatus_cf.AAC.4